MVETVHEKDDEHYDMEIIEDTISGNKNPKNAEEFIIHAGGTEYDKFEKEWNLGEIKDRELEDADKDMEEPDDDSKDKTEHRATQDEDGDFQRKRYKSKGGSGKS